MLLQISPLTPSRYYPASSCRPVIPLLHRMPRTSDTPMRCPKKGSRELGHEKSQGSEYMAGLLPKMATNSRRSKLTLCTVNDLSSPNTTGIVDFGIHKEACACRSNSTPTTSCCCIVSSMSLGNQAPKSSAQLRLTMQVTSETQFALMILQAMTLKASMSAKAQNSRWKVCFQ